MARYQVILAYDGTDFSGFQRQAKARTVQGVFEAALRKLNWQDRTILSAGRTDTGVHAVGQVVAFDLDWSHTPEDLMHALNAHLPVDVAVRSVSLVQAGFHPRYQAVSRGYRYCIFCDAVRHPLRERFAWRVWPVVDISLLEQAAYFLRGRHNFAAFGTPPRSKGSTVRTVFTALWRSNGVDLVFEIVADAFLYHMVRRTVALQVEIGQGKKNPEVIQEYLEGQIASPVQGLAPPQGLVLFEVGYADGEKNCLKMSS